MTDWKKSPLVDVVVVSKYQSCPSDYESLGTAYWWGLKSGCTCRNSKYAQVRKEKCSDKMRQDYCKDTHASKAQWLKIINGKQICGKRIEGLSMMEMTKPKHYSKNQKGVKIQC